MNGPGYGGGGGPEEYHDPYLHERNSLEMDPPRLPSVKHESGSLSDGWKAHEGGSTHDFRTDDRDTLQ